MSDLWALFIVALFAILAIFAFVRWLYPNRETHAITDDIFRRELRRHDQPKPIDNFVLSVSGEAAIARTSARDELIILRRVGDRYSLRVLPVSSLHIRPSKSETALVSIDDFT